MLTIVTYWEGPVSWLERLSAASIVAAGHALEIYSHDIRGVQRQGLPGTVIDVRDILGPNAMADLYRGRKSYAFYTDYVRLGLLREGRGIWADLDFVFRQSLSTTPDGDDYIFGWLNPNRINNAILYAPPQSELVSRYWEAITAVPIRAPWATGHIRVKRSLEILAGRRFPLHPERLAIGPRALTHFIRQLALDHHARRKPVFYPLDDDDAHLLVQADDARARAAITLETVAVHAWRGKLWSIGLSAPPPPASWLGQRCRELGI
jgi:hypothetical protein